MTTHTGMYKRIFGLAILAVFCTLPALAAEVKAKNGMEFSSSASWKDTEEGSATDLAADGDSPEMEAKGSSVLEIAGLGGRENIALLPGVGWKLHGECGTKTPDGKNPYLVLSSWNGSIGLSCGMEIRPVPSLRLRFIPEGSLEIQGFSDADPDYTPLLADSGNFWFRTVFEAGGSAGAEWKTGEGFDAGIKAKITGFSAPEESAGSGPYSGYRISGECTLSRDLFAEKKQRVQLKFGSETDFDSGIVIPSLKHRTLAGVEWKVKDAFSLEASPFLYRFKAENADMEFFGGDSASSLFASRIGYTADGKGSSWTVDLEVPWYGIDSDAPENADSTRIWRADFSWKFDL